MKPLLAAVGFLLATTTVYAQQQPRELQAEAGDKAPPSITLQPAVRAYPSKRRGRIDHSKDKLVVEPTHSTIMILEVSPRVDASPALDESYSRQ